MIAATKASRDSTSGGSREYDLHPSGCIHQFGGPRFSRNEPRWRTSLHGRIDERCRAWCAVRKQASHGTGRQSISEADPICVVALSRCTQSRSASPSAALTETGNRLWTVASIAPRQTPRTSGQYLRVRRGAVSTGCHGRSIFVAHVPSSYRRAPSQGKWPGRGSRQKERGPRVIRAVAVQRERQRESYERTDGPASEASSRRPRQAPSKAAASASIARSRRPGER